MLAKPDMIAEEERVEPVPHDVEPGPFQDIPKSIWTIFLSAWGAVFLIFATVFTTNVQASFAVTISVLFALMAFGLPTLMATQGRCDGFSCPKLVQTHTGPLSVAAAGAQIVSVPVCALIGLIAFVTLAL